MKITDFLLSLAKLAGKEEDEKVKILLANESLKDVEIDDSIKTNIVGSLYTKEAAKNDQDIQDYYYDKLNKKIYGRLDETINEHFDSFNISDEAKESINSKEKITRLDAFLKSVKESKPKKVADNDTVKELNDEIKELKTKLDSKETEFKKELKDFKLNSIIKGKIKGKKLVDAVHDLPGGVDNFADTTISAWKKQHHLDLDDNDNIVIAKKDDPTQKVFIENEELSFDKLLDKDLNKWVKKSEDEPPKPPKKDFIKDDDKPKTWQEGIRKRGRTTSISA